MKTTDVTINNPCSEDWDEMSGGRKRRHCSSCDKDVFHLSEMTHVEARDLLASRDASICVRYRYRQDGTILFRDSTLSGRMELQWEGVRKLVAAAALVPGLALAACDSGAVTGEVSPVASQRHSWQGEPAPVTVTIIDGQAPRVSVTRESSPVVRVIEERPVEEPHIRMGRRAPERKLMGKIAAPVFERMGDVATPREIMGGAKPSVF